MSIVAVIPCRYNSSRLPGKSLATINGRPMMWHTYHRAVSAGIFDVVCIATDDPRVETECVRHGLRVALTRPDHSTGSDRVAECAQAFGAEIVVNVQGDEPMISVLSIRAVVDALRSGADPSVTASNAVAAIDDQALVVSPNTVKVLMAANGMILAYSRAPVPFPHGERPTYYRQLGLYAFRPLALEAFRCNKPGPLERAEEVELYRLLEHGSRVRAVVVEDTCRSVDTPDDLARVRELLGGA